MNRRKIKRVAFHEAGHLVMRWHLDLTATRTVIFENGRDCYCERADDDLSGYENKMLCLAGLAATGRAGKNYMEETLFSLLADHEFFSHETLDSGHDIERLWKTVRGALFPEKRDISALPITSNGFTPDAEILCCSTTTFWPRRRILSQSSWQKQNT